jgi:hypothetical protein
MREGLIAFAVLAVLMVGGAIIRRRRGSATVPAHVPLTDGQLVLRPPRRNAVMFGITALIPAGLLGSVTARMWQLEKTGPVGLVGGIIVTLLVGFVAVYQFVYALRAHIVVRDTGLERIGAFRRRLVGWGSIAKLAFNPVNHWFVVTVSDGSHFWLPADLAGMGEFAALALRRISPAVLRTSDPVVREVLEELAEAAAIPVSAN